MLKKLLNDLIEKLCCKHDWKEYERWSVSTDIGGRYTCILFICKKCGKMKKIKSNRG